MEGQTFVINSAQRQGVVLVRGEGGCSLCGQTQTNDRHQLGRNKVDEGDVRLG